FNDELAREAYDRTLILHLQLNPHPSQEHFRNYRTQLLGFQGDQTEILCINWTPTTTITTAAGTESLARVGGTAWYLRPDKFDDGDATLTDSHCHGLYYTWCQSLRSHVLFFSYHPGVFEVVASKVAHVGVNATLSRRVGPKSKDML